MDRQPIIELAHECAREAWRQGDDDWKTDVRDRLKRAEDETTPRNVLLQPRPLDLHVDRLANLIGADRRELVSDPQWRTFRESYRAELRRQAFRGVRDV